ncbi:hypothetical protein EB796_019921 [Bugula neritina]|uniref:Uncharacterized protein n=1 Tax=Bugula neritina TaxID=10212 RepID=A0A7J7J6W0_BUGNE|nr:hypothetical protein EB796_019921 [Bugula neritina]
MKRRKQKDADGNIIERTDDHREECGGVGSDAVDAPNIAQVPVMVVKEKDKSKQNDDDDDDDEYEYQYEYQYQYQYTDDVPAGPQVMMAPPQGAAPIAAPILSNPEPLFTKTFEAPPAAPQPADEGSEEADGTKTSENDTEKAGEEDYEYEYEDES